MRTVLKSQEYFVYCILYIEHCNTKTRKLTYETASGNKDLVCSIVSIRYKALYREGLIGLHYDCAFSVTNWCGEWHLLNSTINPIWGISFSQNRHGIQQKTNWDGSVLVTYLCKVFDCFYNMITPLKHNTATVDSRIQISHIGQRSKPPVFVQRGNMK